MKDRWRSPDTARDRQSDPRRDYERGDRRNYSPGPGQRGDTCQRSRDGAGTESYRPSRPSEPPRDAARSHPKRVEVLPRSPRSNRNEIPNGRRLEDRITRPRSPSPSHPSKRRRTRSPSPARGDHYIPSQGREVRTRDRFEPSDRRLQPVDRAFSPYRRPSPDRGIAPTSRAEPPEIDSYVPGRRIRESPSPARKTKLRSRSPLRRPQAPASHKSNPRSPRERQLSPYSARALKAKQVKTEKETSRRPPDRSAVGRPNSTPKELFPDAGRDDFESMDGHYNMRGNYHPQNNVMHNRPPRPHVDTRQSYGGSPPFTTPNSSYHGSPQSASSYHQGRGGWNGPPQYHGYQG